jgi:hypothetical protein
MEEEEEGEVVVPQPMVTLKAMSRGKRQIQVGNI